jgi:hypothetical protein
MIPTPTFFVPGARRTLGAYRIPLETGLLIPSVKSSHRNVALWPHLADFQLPFIGGWVVPVFGRSHLGARREELPKLGMRNGELHGDLEDFGFQDPGIHDLANLLPLRPFVEKH